MVKIFIGNLSQDTTSDELRSLFSQYGKIAECTILKNSGFVYMDNQAEAEEAIHNLHQYELNGQPMNVELSRGKSKGSAKLHISNIACTIQELRAKFEEFGTVIECDIVKNNATVRMERIEDAKEAIDKLNNATFKGKLMSIQLSTSRPHTAPGKRGHTGCFVCGKHGHWSKDCPFSCNGGYSDSTGGRSGWALPCGPPSYPKGTYGMASPPADYMSGPPYSQASHIGGLPPPPQRLSGYSSELEDGYRSRGAGSYVERPSVYDHDRLYSSVDYYEKYRARPYDSSYFEDRCMTYPPRPSLLKHPSSIDPSDCQPLRPPSSVMYYAQDCSLIRRVPVPSAGYAYERTQMSLLSASRNSHASPHPKDHFASRYAPY